MSNLKNTSYHLFALLLGMATPPGVSATAIAHSNIGFDTLQIVPAAGDLQLLDSWTVQSFSEAQNSLGEYMSPGFQSSYPGGATSTSAAVTWAAAQDAANSPTPPAQPDLSVTGNASSTVNIPGNQSSFAASDGYSALSNTFQVTGGIGSVSVNLSADISGLLHVFTDSTGILAYTETIFSLQIFGLPDTQNPLLLFFDQTYTIGPNGDITSPFAQTLSNSAMLNYGVSYEIYIEADSESMGAVQVPEPATAALLPAGWGVMLKRRRPIRRGGLIPPDHKVTRDAG